MTIHTARDWRGIKHQLREYSTHELVSVMANAQLTRAQLDQFLDNVADELALRNLLPGPPAA